MPFYTCFQQKKLMLLVVFLIASISDVSAKYIELNPNTPLNQQVIYSNTTYVFKGDCYLTRDFKIPQNCVFVFEGGIITGNHTLEGNNTYIQASPYQIFAEELSLEGSWLNEKCYPEWFGAVGDGKTDDRLAIQKALNIPIPVLEILHKNYLVASYSDKNKKVGLIVPARKTIMGHAVDGWSKEYTISSKDGLAFDVLLQISGIHVSLMGISLFGSRSSDYSSFKVNDIIATNQDKYYTGLNLDYVFVSGCKNNGINLYTYNSSLSNCYVTNCDVAYYIHGGNGRGTSVNLRMCTAERARTNAYKFYKLSYSLLEVCAADHCSLGTITQSHEKGDKYGYNYYYEDCRGISEISCGHESGGFSHYIHDCRGMNIRTGRYTNSGLRDYPDWNDSLSSKMWVIKASADIEIGQTTFASPLKEGSKFVSVDKSAANMRIVQGFYVNQKSNFISVTERNISNNYKVVVFD